MNIIAIIAIILAYIVKGICGFANTLVFGTIMSYSTNNINITPIDLLIGFPANLAIMWKERKSLDPKVYVPLSILVMIGIVPGALFLKNGDTQIVKILFGVVVILIGVESMLRERKESQKEFSKLLLIIVGIISGILCGLFGVGAFLVAYISRTTSNQKEFRGNICVVFLVENLFRIVLYSLSGIITISVFKSALLLAPFMVIGLGIGIFISTKISEIVVKKIVIILLIISGMILVFNNILNL